MRFLLGLRSAEYERLVDHMGLEMDMKVSALSSGMAAKLKLAAAMARDASLSCWTNRLTALTLWRATLL